jgi:SAM-dependent methyltransferase
MDVDLSTRLDALDPLLELIVTGRADVVFGSRLERGSSVKRSLRRELASRAYNLIARLALGYPVRDAQCGFKAIRRTAAQALIPNIENDKWFFDTELLTLAWRSGMRLKEVPVFWVEDDDSRVKMVSTALEDLRGIWRLMHSKGWAAQPSKTAGDSGPVFDLHAERYKVAVDRSISFTGKDADFFAERKVALLRELSELHHRPLDGASVLDVGCGTGSMDQFLVKHALTVTGVDVSEEMVAIAQLSVPDAVFSTFDGNTLPYADGSFDVVVAACVLHHVEVSLQRHFVEELRRVLKPGGLVAIFEHNPINPLTRRAVRGCELDRGVTLLGASQVKSLLRSGGLEILGHSYYLFTPFGGPWSLSIDSVLRRVPLGGQHVVLASGFERECKR